MLKAKKKYTSSLLDIDNNDDMYRSFAPMEASGMRVSKKVKFGTMTRR